MFSTKIPEASYSHSSTHEKSADYNSTYYNKNNVVPISETIYGNIEYWKNAIANNDSYAIQCYKDKVNKLNKEQVIGVSVFYVRPVKSNKDIISSLNKIKNILDMYVQIVREVNVNKFNVKSFVIARAIENHYSFTCMSIYEYFRLSDFEYLLKQNFSLKDIYNTIRSKIIQDLSVININGRNLKTHEEIYQIVFASIGNLILAAYNISSRIISSPISYDSKCDLYRVIREHYVSTSSHNNPACIVKKVWKSLKTNITDYPNATDDFFNSVKDFKTLIKYFALSEEDIKIITPLIATLISKYAPSNEQACIAIYPYMSQVRFLESIILEVLQKTCNASLLDQE